MGECYVFRGGSAAVKGPDYTYTGQSECIKERGGWKLKLLTSGTLRFAESVEADVFLVGGGASGAYMYRSNNYDRSGGGGGGGYTQTVRRFTIQPSSDYSIVVGAGGDGVGGSTSPVDGQDGGATSAFGYTAKGGKGCSGAETGKAVGGDGGSGGGAGISVTSAGHSAGNGGTDGSDGGYSSNNNAPGAGQNTTTREFGESGGDLYAGGGGGGGASGTPGTGGDGGGGNGASATTAAGHGASGKGGGGGGGCYCVSDTLKRKSGNGGSGIVIIRNYRIYSN